MTDRAEPPRRSNVGRMSERNEHNDGNTQTAYFAGGCFWGLERYFQNVDGVTDTTVGYAQSTVESPTYEQVCAGGTDAAETVKVEFNPAQVSLRTLTLLFLEVIDPFSVDQQGEDRGRRYTALAMPRHGRDAARRVCGGLGAAGRPPAAAPGRTGRTAAQLLPGRGTSSGLSGEQSRRLLPCADRRNRERKTPSEVRGTHLGSDA